MKNLMILGALVGFMIGALFSFFQNAPWPDILWRASVVSFAASYLFRWWGRAWLRSLHAAHAERLSLENSNSQPTSR